MILISKYITPKGYQGITLYPFVFLKHTDLKQDAVLINHENIHLKQQIELFIIPFYLWYVLEFLLKWVRFKSWKVAYLNISFEREAYANERHLDYVKSRSSFAFLKYL